MAAVEGREVVDRQHIVEIKSREGVRNMQVRAKG